MNSINCFVGIDVSKLKLHVALLRNEKIKSKTVTNEVNGFKALHAWLLRQGVTTDDTWICLEATGAYSESAATFLADSHWPVSVVNPVRVKGFSQSESLRNKTDKVDAALIARFCQALRPERWYPPSQEVRVLRGFIDRLAELKETLQQEQNRIEAYSSQGQDELVANVELHVKWLQEQIETLSKTIDDHIDRHPGLKNDDELIKSIPGVGDVTSATLLAYLGDIRRFDSAKALAAYTGVTPRNRQSGTSVQGRTVISRMGHNQLRTALYMPGLVARHHNPALKVFGDRLRDRGLNKKAVVCAVMRKLVHIIYGVIKSGKPFDATLAMPSLDFKDGI